MTSEHSWTGFGHKPATFNAVPTPSSSASTPSTPITLSDTADSPEYLSALQSFATFPAAEVYAVSHGKRLKFEDWAKLQTCNHCGQRGRVRPQCPKYKAERSSLNGCRDFRCSQRTQESTRQSCNTQNDNNLKGRRRFQQAAWILNALVEVDNENSSSGDSSAAADQGPDADAADVADNASSYFANVASALGSVSKD